MIKISTNTAALAPLPSVCRRLATFTPVATDPAPYTPLTAPLVTGLVPPAQEGVSADAYSISTCPTRDDVPALLANMHASDPPPLPLIPASNRTLRRGFVEDPALLQRRFMSKGEGKRMWDAKGE